VSCTHSLCLSCVLLVNADVVGVVLAARQASSTSYRRIRPTCSGSPSSACLAVTAATTTPSLAIGVLTCQEWHAAAGVASASASVVTLIRDPHRCSNSATATYTPGTAKPGDTTRRRSCHTRPPTAEPNERVGVHEQHRHPESQHINTVWYRHSNQAGH
jgi:hypothetical protein